ncbi:glycosyltransferase [Roseiconus nitratireducens]|uniref:glycosyltransferase n=1 Tax=Roseiconus nitratireducens TaxID=2605748 RepID=UPI0013757519|nr:glycosyltransferase [Roseiconus nitratireducens]
MSLFYRALSNHDVRLVGNMKLSRSWLRKNIDSFDAVHFHWPEGLLTHRPGWVRSLQRLPGCWRCGEASKWLSPPFRLLQLREFLRLARNHGKQVVWTIHNITPHEGESPIQRRTFECLASYATLLICHDGATARECRERFQTEAQIVVMPHGNYDGAYPPPRSRELVRRELGVAEDIPLLACLGNLRHYKGIDLACRAVECLPSNVHLLIAGKRHPQFSAGCLHSMAGSPQITLVERSLTEQEFADYANASDGILLPYRSVTGSGALLAALTFGRGVIASDLPYFKELLSGAPDAGKLFRVGDAAELASVIPEYLAIPAAIRGSAARALAEQYDWKRVIRPVAMALGERHAATSVRLGNATHAELSGESRT